jgi:hypothetical protein
MVSGFQGALVCRGAAAEHDRSPPHGEGAEGVQLV